LRTSYAFMLMKAGKPKQAERVLQELLSTKLTHDMEMQAKSNLAKTFAETILLRT